MGYNHVYTEKGLKRAEHVRRFIQNLHHTQTPYAGKPFILAPWQWERIIKPLYGVLNDTGLRQYRTCLTMLPRKNGKSEICAALALYHLFADGVNGGQVYSAAVNKEQASLVFNVAAQMVRQNPALNSRCKIVDSQKRIIYYEKNNFYRAIPADAPGAHGFNASAIIYDEVHTAAKRDLFDALATSMGVRDEPLMIMITTAGYDRNSILWEQYTYAQKIIKDIESDEVEDKTFLPVIYEASQDDDWTASETWYKANPALGDFRKLDELENQCKKAQALPSYQNTFKQLYLNQWVGQATRWIDMKLWDSQAGEPIDEISLIGKKGCGGLDLSSVSDLTAWVMAFPRYAESNDESFGMNRNNEVYGKIDILCRFWCPEARLYADNNKYKDHYQAWARDGYLFTTPGDAVDYQFVKKQIVDDCNRFKILGMNIDRLFQGFQLAMELEDALDGITEVSTMGMGHLSFAIPMKEFERKLLNRQLHHGGNPVLKFMADNVAVKPNAAGDLKPDKAASQGKIDGIVALVMAISQLLQHEDKTSVYEEQELFVF